MIKMIESYFTFMTVASLQGIWWCIKYFSQIILPCVSVMNKCQSRQIWIYSKKAKKVGVLGNLATCLVIANNEYLR